MNNVIISGRIQSISFTPGREDGQLLLEIDGQDKSVALNARDANADLICDNKKMKFAELLVALATNKVWYYKVTVHQRPNFYMSAIKAKFVSVQEE